MSVFAVSQPTFFSAPSYTTQSTPVKKESTNESPISIPTSLSKLSLSLTEPIRRIFTNPNSSVTSAPISSINSANDSSSTISTISTSTSSTHGHPLERESDIELTAPPPTYFPIKSAPKTVSPPAYEPSISTSIASSRASLQRTQTRAVEEAERESAWRYGYVSEIWAGSKSREERVAEEEEIDGEKHEGSCWCTQWWMVTGTTGGGGSLPWIAYAIY